MRHTIPLNRMPGYVPGQCSKQYRRFRKLPPTAGYYEAETDSMPVMDPVTPMPDTPCPTKLRIRFEFRLIERRRIGDVLHIWIYVLPWLPLHIQLP